MRGPQKVIFEKLAKCREQVGCCINPGHHSEGLLARALPPVGVCFRTHWLCQGGFALPVVADSDLYSFSFLAYKLWPVISHVC